MPKMTTVYVSKWALTKGVEVVETADDTTNRTVRINAGACDDWNLHGNDWHTTREAAVARAEQMRLKKIASLRRSLAKMEALSFA